MWDLPGSGMEPVSLQHWQVDSLPPPGKPLREHLKGKVKAAQSCLTCDSMDYTWNSPGQNTGVGSHSLLQRNLPNPGI